MRVELVTSFSPAGADLYGRRCVAGLKAYWPHPATVYVDAPMALSGVTVRPTGLIPGWQQTREHLPKTRPEASYKPTSYLWDARRFAVKPFVWLDAAERMATGVLVWLDGDTVTTNPVPTNRVTDMLADADVAYLGRGDMHPETGCVAFRVPEALPLLRWCRDGYYSGSFRSLADGWTDCHVLRAGLRAVPVKARDLTSHLWTGEWRSGVDVMALSPLGPYVEHLKGSQRKRESAA